MGPGLYHQRGSIALLARSRPTAAADLKALPWTSNGMTRGQAEAAADLAAIGVNQPELYANLLAKPWIQQYQPDALRGPTLRFLSAAAFNSPQNAGLLANSPFLKTLDSRDGDARESIYLSLSFGSPPFGSTA